LTGLVVEQAIDQKYLITEKILNGDFETNMELLGSIIPIENDDKFMKLVRKLYERNIEAGTVQQLRQDFKKI
jgi:hypothetical protein